MMRAPVCAGERGAALGEHLPQPAFDVEQRSVFELAERDAGLIADHEQRVRVRGEHRERFARARRETHQRGIGVVGHVFEQRAVLVDEHSG